MSQSAVILTPLFDPSGRAIPLFRNCIDSVMSQVACDWTWIVSVQQASPAYESMLRDLSRHEAVEIVDNAGARSLSAHLISLLHHQGIGANHILCQDDFYSCSTALLEISALARTYGEVSVAPNYRRLEIDERFEPASLMPCEDGRTQIRGLTGEDRLLELVGINRLGGLSTIAWWGRRVGFPLETDLYVDMELRLKLKSRSHPGIRADGGLVTEHVWPGQSQHEFSQVRKSEMSRWCARRASEGVKSSLALVTCIKTGDVELARAWSSQMPRGWWIRPANILAVANAVVELLVTGRFFSRVARRIRRPRALADLHSS